MIVSIGMLVAYNQKQ